MNIEEDLVGTGVDAASVGSEHDLVKRFVENLWAGGDIGDVSTGDESEKLGKDGPEDYSYGQDEEVGMSKGDGTSVRESKKKINDLQEVGTRPRVRKTRATEDSDPSIIEFQNEDVIWDSESQSLSYQVQPQRRRIYRNVVASLLICIPSRNDLGYKVEVNNIILMLLMVPIWLLYKLLLRGASATSPRLISVIIISTLVYSAVFSAFTKAKRHEILAASAW